MKKNMLAWALLLAVLFVSVPFVHAQQADSVSPSIPTGVSASINQAGQVSVSWGASTDNVGVAGYRLYRNGAAIVSTADAGYIDTVPAGVYFYSVSAFDAAGNVSQQSIPASVSVIADTTSPSAPSNLTFTNTSSSITLSWGASTDNVGVVGYSVFRNGMKLQFTSGLTGTSYTDNDVSSGNTYSYNVEAYDAAGNYSNHSATVNVTLIFDVTPPTSPQQVKATVKSSTEIDLSWSPSTDNVAVSGYYVYRDGGLATTITSPTSTSYVDSSLSAGTTHLYQVVAYDTVGNLSQQNLTISATTLAPDLTPPWMAQQIYAQGKSTSEIDLSWAPASDNVGVAGYYVYRAGTQIATVGSTTTSYADIGLATGTTYQYAVVAYDAAANLSPKVTVAGTTLLANSVFVAPVIPIATTTLPLPGTDVPPSTGGGTPSVPASGSAVFTVKLYAGLRNDAVTTLQTFLVKLGYLSANRATGYYGAITQAAVQKLQCDKNIICSGSPWTTGWGMVGVRTRAMLNSLYGQ